MTESESKLFNDSLIEDNTGILFEQYKLYVELTDRVSERRQNVNTFFLVITHMS